MVNDVTVAMQKEINALLKENIRLKMLNQQQ